ncbi:MAG: hypothetical protein HS115_01830 [Spirochaetales bacterium]|nr:hypothetical protein [Spirochaetales bacterium]
MILLLLLCSNCLFESTENRVARHRSDNSFNCMVYALTVENNDPYSPAYSTSGDPVREFGICCITIKYGCGKP